MLVIHNAAQIVCISKCGERLINGSLWKKDLSWSTADRPVVLPDASMMVHGERITWLGPAAELPTIPPGATVMDVTGKVIVPGFVDSHTHLIFAGTREDEFEQRLQGATYQEISAKGGGISSTVQRVRQSTKEELKALARPRLKRMLAGGVTTVEVKSGYGLTLADELKSLQAIAELNEEGPLELVPTFLGAHSVPPEFANDRAGYGKLLIDEMLPEISRQRLAEFCDVFCETGVFSLQESEAILHKARELGFQLKLHADELTPLGGAELAGRLSATSADHLLCITDAGIDALAKSGTVATLLPGTAFFLGLPYGPARKLLERGCAVALASDCNPGTCMTENLALVGAMACCQMKMLPAEAITAMTLNGAAALGRSQRIGSLEEGKQADFLICDIPDYRHLFYHFGVNHVWRVIKRGRVVFAA